MSGSLSFNGTGDALTVSLGAANVTAAFTWAFVVKATDKNAGVADAMDDSAGTFNFGANSSDELFWYNGTTVSQNATLVWSYGSWIVLIVRKAAGSATPRMSKVLLPSGTTTHANATTGAIANKSATTSYRIGGHVNFQGLVACTAMAKSNLADGVVAGLLNWSAFVGAGFDERWRLDGTAPFNGSGTSTQSALTGTSHSTDEPPGFWGVPNRVRRPSGLFTPAVAGSFS